MSTAPALTDARQAARERVLQAAVEWVGDQACSQALAELEDSVEALLNLAGERRRKLLAAPSSEVDNNCACAALGASDAL